jgi:hypothetical protein
MQAQMRNYTCYVTSHLHGYNCLFTVQAQNIKQARQIALPLMQAYIVGMPANAINATVGAKLASKYTLQNLHLTLQVICY